MFQLVPVLLMQAMKATQVEIPQDIYSNERIYLVPNHVTKLDLWVFSKI